ncbi:MAG: hypothetical protein ABIJ82_02715 [Patescibacteria group bacterium]
MKNNKTTSTKEKSDPTAPREIDMDELAKLWIELVLQQIQRKPVVLPQDSLYNMTIGQIYK